MGKIIRKDIGLNGDVYDIEDDGTVKYSQKSSLTLIQDPQIEKEIQEPIMVDDSDNSVAPVESKPNPSKKHKTRHVIVPILTFLLGAGTAVGVGYGVQQLISKKQSSFEEKMLTKYSQVKCTSDCTITLNVEESNATAPDLKYSKDGSTWTAFEAGTGVDFKTGDCIYLKGNNPNGFSYEDVDGNSHINKISITNGSLSLAGNIMGLIYDGDETKTELPEGKRCFDSLFMDSTGIISIDKLTLPATIAKEKCYSHMFEGCTNLTNIPNDLIKLTSQARNACNKMFMGCTSLTDVSGLKLAATSMAELCYQEMFSGCTKLTKAPILPSTTLAENCYKGMFYNCTSLVSAPNLPAESLAEHCYYEMFYGCASLKTLPTLGFSSTAQGSCYSMFEGCTALEEIIMPSTITQGAKWCFNRMFNGCTNLNKITVSFASWKATDNENEFCALWVENIKTNGTFVCPNVLTEIRGVNNIPVGWTVQRQ